MKNEEMLLNSEMTNPKAETMPEISALPTEEAKAASTGKTETGIAESAPDNSQTPESKEESAAPAEPAPKPRRATRKKKTETSAEEETAPESSAEPSVPEEESHLPELLPGDIPSLTEPVPDAGPEPVPDVGLEPIPVSSPAPTAAPPEPPMRTSRARPSETSILSLDARTEVETDEAREDAIWHEIHNAYRTRKILTGQLGGIEQTDNGKTIAIVDYKGFRIVIPLKEMMISLGRLPSGEEYREEMIRQNKILGNMLGAEIDFIVRGIDSKTRSVVASRREAMLRKRQIFYLDTDANGMYRIYEGRIVQARVIAVAEKVVRVEVFGVECSIMARDLAWDWIGDAHERFSVGDQVLVRILKVRRDTLEDLGIQADMKSVSQNTNHDNLKKCRIQSKYAGKVTDIHKGVVYVRLSNGVNAIAHSCYDYRTPGKKDDVSFAVTRIDEERGVAVGIITRIIRQNL